MANDPEKEVKNYLAEYEKLKGDRAPFESYWQDVSKLMLPSRDFFGQYMPGQKRNTRIFDTTGMYATLMLANGLHSMLTSPMVRWFSVVSDGPPRRISERGRQWLDLVTDELYRTFCSEQGMFNVNAHEMYLELSGFGTGVMFSNEDYSERRVRYRARSLSQCVIVENQHGIVDKIYVCDVSKAINVVRFFGADRCSEKVRKLAQDKPHETVEIINVVEPRVLGLGDSYGRLAENMRFKSCFFEKDTKHKIFEGGYEEFPYQVPRWTKRSNEDYGFGPGMAAYPDVRQLNRMAEVTIRSMEKTTDPPLQVPDDSVFGPLVINPGGIIKKRPGSEDIKPLITNAQPQLSIEYIAQYQSRVMQHFYMDWLNQPVKSGNPITASEATMRRDERFRMLGPMLSRVQTEYLGPLIKRTYNAKIRLGHIPPPPEDIRGIRIDYLSPIAQAQRFADLESIMRAVQTGAYMAQYDPEVMRNFNMDAITRWAAQDVNSVPQRLMNSEESVAAGRENAAQERSAAQQAVIAETQSKAFKNSANGQKFLAQTETQGTA